MARLGRLLPESIKKALKRRLVRIEVARPYEVVVDPTARPLAGKIAVVTGASGAIGRAITVRLALDGAKVTAVARDEFKLNKLAAELAELGEEIAWKSLDLADTAAIRAFSQSRGGIDILVNNAGGSARSRHSAIWHQSPETIDEILDVNLRATMHMVAAFGEQLSQGGRIINLGSSVGVGGLAEFSEYAAAKAGVAGFTRSAALEFGPRNITVNCVSPGIVQRDEISYEIRDKTLSKAILPELGTAEDVAELITFLAGPKAGWITGQQIMVDGGRTLGLYGES